MLGYIFVEFIVSMPCGRLELTSDQRMHESTCNNAKCRIRRSNLFKTLHKKKEAEQKSMERAQKVRAWISEKPKGAMAQCPFCDVSLKVFTLTTIEKELFIVYQKFAIYCIV